MWWTYDVVCEFCEDGFALVFGERTHRGEEERWPKYCHPYHSVTTSSPSSTYMSMPASPFPPSFSSFPDIDPGPSNRAPSPTRNEPHGHHHRDDFSRRDKSAKRIHRDKDRPSSKREKHLSPSDNWRTNEPPAVDPPLDDERLKANEDRRRLEQQGQEHDRWVPRPLFYSDRKGDSLNLTYGRLHTGDVPKYRPVAREYQSTFTHSSS